MGQIANQMAWDLLRLLVQKVKLERRLRHERARRSDDQAPNRANGDRPRR